MIKKVLLTFIIIFISIYPKTYELLPFNKVIIWGHKLHTHTHSYIHYAFHKTFSYLGYNTYWLDNNDDVSNFNFSNALFITEGQVDGKIPLRSDCYYILHNCDQTKYNGLYNNVMFLQTYTNECLNKDVEKLDDCIYAQYSTRYLYMPWATDLLPYEINVVKNSLYDIKKQKIVYYNGTIWGEFFGNINEIEPFMKACQENNILFEHNPPCNISNEFNFQTISSAYMAPAIVGTWQKEKGYIPCRIFKNISYGQMGITNSKTVFDLFKEKIIYNPNTYELFYDAQRNIENGNMKQILELMDFVKEKHTYINRIDSLLSFFNEARKRYTTLP